MTAQSTCTHPLVFRRLLLGGKVTVLTECLPGSVTVLQDDNGSDLVAYENFFLEKASKERILIETGGIAATPSSVMRIGFNELISPELSIQKYLAAHGYGEAEISDLMSSYELEKCSYLPCAHLPIGPQRIVQLLAALRSEFSTLVLKDPFMPFSGRWREHFAKLLLENSRDRSRVVVCMNLSFVPQTWSNRDGIKYLDVGQAAEEMRAHYRIEQERKRREQQEKTSEREVTTTIISEISSRPTTAAAPGSPEQTDSTPAYYLKSAYREAHDRILTPLKELSDFLRSYNALVITGCMAFLIAAMGVAAAPNLGELQKKMRSLRTDPLSFIDVMFRVQRVAEPASLQEIASQNSETRDQLLLPAYEYAVPSGVDELLAIGELPLLSYLNDASSIEVLTIGQLCEPDSSLRVTNEN